jgi:hypothetical protein
MTLKRRVRNRPFDVADFRRLRYLSQRLIFRRSIEGSLKWISRCFAAPRE